MQYDEIDYLRAHHPAWVLLRSDNVALVLSFLGRVFVEGNASDLPAAALAEELDDELYARNQGLEEPRFPRSAAAYLDEWASSDRDRVRLEQERIRFSRVRATLAPWYPHGRHEPS